MSKLNLVCIDPGHGGADIGAPGAIQDPVCNESNINLNVALLLAGLLEDAGIGTFLTRQKDVFRELSFRSHQANSSKADLFISLHCNSASTKSANGIETWIYTGSKSGLRYAKPVQDSLIRAFPAHKDRGVKQANFHVLRATKMPAILVEMEFIQNQRMCKFLSGPANQQRLAEAIFEGVMGG